MIVEAAGIQPSLKNIEPVGYLMRIPQFTAQENLSGRSHFWATRPEFFGSFQPELLAVWLIRPFTIDIVEHMAAAKLPQTAVPLDPKIRRRIGVGNSTGLGMAPFLINHPSLIHSLINAQKRTITSMRVLQALSKRPIQPPN